MNTYNGILAHNNKLIRIYIKIFKYPYILSYLDLEKNYKNYIYISYNNPCQIMFFNKKLTYESFGFKMVNKRQFIENLINKYNEILH